MRLCLILVVVLGLMNVAQTSRMVCFYDATSFLREGLSQLSMLDLQPALQFCNYLVYGYAGIDAATYRIKPLQPELDLAQHHFRAITMLRRQFSHLHILLSVGGDQDLVDGEKYLKVLETAMNRKAFVDSTVELLHQYGFDGIDLAWQFPKRPPKQMRGLIGRALHKVKTWFVGEQSIDPLAEEHKTGFSSLVAEMRLGLGGSDFSLTIMPHVDPELFIDPETVTRHVDFINLATFDFQTPERDPKVADYPAPLYEPFERDQDDNVDYQVQWWTNQSVPLSFLNIGVPAFGRAWIMTRDSGITGHPPVPHTAGAAPPGLDTLTSGLLSWPEVCAKMHNNTELKGAQARLRKVGDPTRRYGSYAYRAAEEEDDWPRGMWVGYEDPTTAAHKAGYVRAKGLGGVALFDLSLDDFRGECAGEKFPILRSIKYSL